MQVTLVPAQYNPLVNPISELNYATTNDSGTYEFRAVSIGQYNILAVQPGTSDRLMIRDIASSNDRIAIPSDTLRQCGFIRVKLPDTINTANGYVYIPGTTIAVVVSASGSALLDSVPEGLFSQIAYAEKGSSSVPRIIADSVMVFSDDTTIVMYAAWNLSKRLYFNTTASGANVFENVVNFPVLVRLTQSNFDFSQAQTNGADIRFSKENGMPLAYEIEQWDAVGETAALWVKADTVYGNDSSHFMLMYWGNPQASKVSNGASVFDTADGNVGVWHLNETAGDVLDATQNANIGKSENTVVTPGLIGNARSFALSRIYMGAASRLCNLSDSITVSGWIKTTQSPSTMVSVFRHVGNFTALQFDSTRILTSFWPVSSSTYSVVGTPIKTANITDGMWHYFASTYKTGVGCTVYMDGVLLNTNTSVTSALALTTGAFYLGGTESNNEFFEGDLDEARVERICRSADWIRLCYVNQSTPDKLVHMN